MLALFAIFMALVAAVLMTIAWSGRGSFTGEDPLCAKCRYCVRGLEGTICPECGSDLRDVGILAPGSTTPISRGRRLLIWSLAVPLPALILFGMLSPIAVPQWMSTTRRRVIFSQASYCSVTITGETHGKKLSFGYPSSTAAPVAPEVLFLSHDRSHMDVQLPARTYRFTDRAGNVVAGKYDAKAIETWLNDGGFNDPRVAERAADIAAAVDEIGTPAGNGFTRFPAAPNALGTAIGIAHPTFTFNMSQPNTLTSLSRGGLVALMWLVGLPLVLRQTRRRTSFVPSAGADAIASPAHA